MAQYLVIGGACGVGSAVVSALRQRGDTVIASVLNDKESTALAATHNDVRSFHLDLGQPDTVAAAISAAIGTERLDGVAVCAALAPIGVLETSTLADLAKTLDVNVVSALAIF